MSDSRNDRGEELFLIPTGGDYYVYAPLRRGVALLNGAAARTVAKYLHEDPLDLDPREQSVIDELKEGGLLGGQTPKLPVVPADYEFKPYEVTLFPTTRCNLRCIYCYADAGSGGVRELSWDAAKAAIDLVVRNAGHCGRDNFIVGFHGGGEPTLAWDFMRRCVEYAHEQAALHGLTAKAHSASNGILTVAQREYIMSHFSGLNVSLDGPRDIQDRNRPRADGTGSFDAVIETLRHFSDNGFSFGIRATVTAQSVLRLDEICRFVFRELPGLKQLHIEPVWYCGRCRTSGERPPDPLQFATAFIRAREEARKQGKSVVYSGARLEMLTNKFCAAPGDGFSVMPDGRVSSCFEVCDSDDPRSRVFHYGRYDQAAGGYLFDRERLDGLRRLSVDNISFCRDCFCRWHCAGDCVAKALRGEGPDGHHGSERCLINREITLAQLKELIAESENEQSYKKEG
jgi:uncharacterized protein